MSKKNVSTLKILSVMFGFFIMGFVDIIGISTNYVKSDFPELNDAMVNLISLSCFLWFFILSIPTGILMNKIGRKNTVVLSFALTVVAMLLPLVDYSFTSILIAFAFIGIGNTLLQVALNPLVTNVISGDRLTSTLTLGQFVKAICSFLSPLIAAWVVGSFLGWKMIFPIYALVSLIAMIWLWATPIQKEETNKNVSIKVTLNLLKDKYILAFFIGILIIVGVDVSINVTFPKLLMERCDLTLSNAVMGNSVYFFSRIVGTFLGGLLLIKFSEIKFFKFSVFLSMIGLIGMFLFSNVWVIMVFVSMFGLGYANLFAIIFSVALKRVPEKANEVSALLIVGVGGGAILPPILGIFTDIFKTQTSAIIIIALVWIYMIWLIGSIKKCSALNAESEK
ncbi:MAG: MFS transporter [Prolixibacteraceae bacterium]|nr:MFS transporter [Prolixibacteraceae bacterium]